MAEPNLVTANIQIPVDNGKGILNLTSLPQDWTKVVGVIEQELGRVKTPQLLHQYYQVKIQIFYLFPLQVKKTLTVAIINNLSLCGGCKSNEGIIYSFTLKPLFS